MPYIYTGLSAFAAGIILAGNNGGLEMSQSMMAFTVIMFILCSLGALGYAFKEYNESQTLKAR